MQSCFFQNLELIFEILAKNQKYFKGIAMREY